jgi:hypothetical protein
MTVNERSMLSPSRFKIHEPLVTGVSPRRTDQRGARKLRNTRVRTGKIMAVDPALRG